MKKKLPIITAVLLALIIFSSQGQDFTALLKKIDNMGNFNQTDISLVYTVVSTKPGEDKSTLKVQVYRRDSEEKLVMIILEPGVQAGQGYLRAGDSFWFYDPNTRDFQYISLKENFQDSEAKNSDFKPVSLAEDYSVTASGTEEINGISCYVLTLKAKHNEVTYDTMKLWISKNNEMILKEEDYSINGRLMRTAYFANSYIKAAGQLIPKKILIVDELNPGEKTQMTISDVDTGKIPDSYFSKGYLERVNED